MDQNTPSTIVITCAARNGTPDVHNITLMKSGSVIASTIGGNTLNYTVPVTMDGLGQYVCEVNSLYSTQQKSLVLRGSGMTSISMLPQYHFISNSKSHGDIINSYISSSLSTASNDTGLEAYSFRQNRCHGQVSVELM